MKFAVLLGEPEVSELWHDLLKKGQEERLTSNEKEFFDKWSKALELLSQNPRHPGLKSHEIDELSRKYGIKIWQSYLENKKSGAKRMFWTYGPKRNQMTILAVEKHPEVAKHGAYARIRLSRLP
jgi:hypothetical protein